MTTGKLTWGGKKKEVLQAKFISKKGKNVSSNVKEAELSASLKSLKEESPKQLEDMEVEFELVNGQPTQIRPIDEMWQSAPDSIGDFHNPYNFVPAPPRDKYIEKSELGDHPPTGHGSYRNDLWSGHITMSLTTKSPLLIPDAAIAKEDQNGHKTFNTRVNENQLPLLPATSIKGMLRSAYEIITNSRFSIFENHGDRLAYRMPAEMGVVPVRIQQLDDDEITFTQMDIAKLKRYMNGENLPLDKGESEEGKRFQDKTLPNHGDPVWVQLDAEQQVSRIVQRNNDSKKTGWRKGWVYLTGANIKNKRFERVFLEQESQKSLTFSNKVEGSKKQDRQEIIELWSDLIRDYQTIHKKDLKQRLDDGNEPGVYLGDEPGKTGWSRHIYEDDSENLKPGTLCYIEMEDDETISAIVPVIISRHLYQVEPNKLLDISLHPPDEIKDLSPSDRVFGWVRRGAPKQNDFKATYKGNLRVSAVRCLAESREDAIKDFPGDGLPLTILGAPKPEQARFYLAQDQNGTPMARGADKAKSYQIGQGLRGRKIYPHHQGLPENYWREPTKDRTQLARDGYFQEYRRPRKDRAEQRDDQNRSLKDWVKQDVVFSARIDVTNLSDVELGALLYLLCLPENHFHRLGGGKPLGFGSVRLDVDWEQTDLRLGSTWKMFYQTLDVATLKDVLSDPRSTILTYQKEVENIDEKSRKFESVPFIQAFLQAAKGFDDQKPIHYPRVRRRGIEGKPAPHPDGESFKWFTENERTRKKGRDCLPLPSLLNEAGLPYLDDKSKSH